MSLTPLAGLVVMLSVTGMAAAQSERVTKTSGRLSRLMREQSPDYKLMRSALAIFGFSLLPMAFAAYWLQGPNSVSVGAGVALAMSGVSLVIVAAGDWISSRWKLPGPRFHAVSVGTAVATGGAVVVLEALLGWQGHTWHGMFWASISLLGIQLLSAGLMSFTREEKSTPWAKGSWPFQASHGSSFSSLISPFSPDDRCSLGAVLHVQPWQRKGLQASRANPTGRQRPA